MNITASLAALAAATFLAGCISPVAASLSQDDYMDVRANMERLAALPRPRFYEMPTEGLVTYRGAITTNLKSMSGIVGALDMDVNFATSDITGTISEVNYVENGVPDQMLKGSLALSGRVTNSLMDASATGPLTAVAYGMPASVAATLNLTGKFRNDTAIADTVTGSVSGEISGIVNHTFGSGSFYAQADAPPE